MCALATLLHDMSPITGVVAHNRWGYGRLSHITEARSTGRSDRRLAKGEQRLLPRGWRLLSESSYCLHNAPVSVNASRVLAALRSSHLGALGDRAFLRSRYGPRIMPPITGPRPDARRRLAQPIAAMGFDLGCLLRPCHAGPSVQRSPGAAVTADAQRGTRRRGA
jgi:hypothetical protein